MPISLARIWAKVVACPWPWLIVPSRAITLPVGCTRISQESNMPRPRISQFLIGPAPTISVKKLTPMPINLRVSPRAKPSRLRRCSSQGSVADSAQGLVERRQVIATVVFPAERRLVRELLLADQIPAPDFRRVDIEPVRQHVDHALDEIRRLGHPEGAAISDAARRLVG